MSGNAALGWSPFGKWMIGCLFSRAILPPEVITIILAPTSFATDNDAYGVEVNGNYAYVAQEYNVEIVNNF